VIKNITKI